MKLTLTLTVEVEPRGWAAEYGTGTTPALVADDVERYITAAVAESYAGEHDILTVQAVTREKVPA